MPESTRDTSLDFLKVLLERLPGHQREFLMSRLQSLPQGGLDAFAKSQYPQSWLGGLMTRANPKMKDLLTLMAPSNILNLREARRRNELMLRLGLQGEMSAGNSAY